MLNDMQEISDVEDSFEEKIEEIPSPKVASPLLNNVYPFNKD